MNKTTLLLVVVLLGITWIPAKGKPTEQPTDDSTKVKSTLTLTPRLNSAGYFPFTGSIINHHVNMDVNLFYEKGGRGFFLFKSFDPVDVHSSINYFQPGAFVTIRPRSAFRLRVFAGYLFSQTTHFRDEDSDFYSALGIYWDITPQVKVQHTVLYYDVQTNSKLANRLLVTWQSKALKVDVYLWHRWVMEEHSEAISGSVAVTYSLELSERCRMELTGSYLSYLTQEMPSYALRRGLVLTVGIPLALGR